jgi:hypothetical protein
VQAGGGASTVFEFTDADTICWPNVNMQGITMATVRYGNGEPTGDTITLTLGGTQFGSITVSMNTGGWVAPMLADASTTFTAQAGTGTVCLVGMGTGQVASIDYLKLQ